MSVAENKRSVIVGIFVLVGLIIFVAGILILGGRQKRFTSTITVSAVFDNVAGLRTGNNVWFSGVKIGTIRKIGFFGKSQVEVTFNLEEDAQEYIRQNAVARISSESFIGNKNIVIEGGTPEAPPVVDGSRLKGVNPLDTDDLMETLQENNENIQAITSDFKVISERLVQGEGTVGALLTDTSMAQNVRTMVANLQQTSANTVRVSRALNQFAAKLNTEGGLVDELLTDTSVFDQLQASMDQLQEATTAATTMAQNLQTASTKLNSQDNALGVMLNDPNFANQLQRTMQNLETSTEKLDENMEALQHNFLLRGFFRKRDRAAANQ